MNQATCSGPYVKRVVRGLGRSSFGSLTAADGSIGGRRDRRGAMLLGRAPCAPLLQRLVTDRRSLEG